MKKSLWMILFVSLLGLTWMRLKPIDSTLYMAPERIALTPDEAFIWTLYHPASTHPFLYEEAIVGVTLKTPESQVNLRLESMNEPLEAGPLYATNLTLSFPWEDAIYPIRFENATLSIRLINDEVIAFDGIHVGVFTPDTLQSYSIESLYGLFQDEHLEGLYIRVKNRTQDPIDIAHMHLGFSDLLAPREVIRMTNDSFIPGQPLSDYTPHSLAPIEPGETRTMLVPFHALAPVGEVPVCLGFKEGSTLKEECIAPFLFIQRRIHEDQLIQGHSDDSN